MTARQTPTQPRPLPSSKTPGLSEGAAPTNKPSATELSDDALDRVAGGQLSKPPEPPDPCIK